MECPGLLDLLAKLAILLGTKPLFLAALQVA